jgi:hypothetical protein
LQIKTGHCHFQNRPPEVETGQYPKLREHPDAVVAINKLSSDWHDFRAKLDKLYPRIGKPTQLSLEFAVEDSNTGKGLKARGRQPRRPPS